jgi:hypothetical protein
MQTDFEYYLNLYKEYTELFYKQIVDIQVFKEIIDCKSFNSDQECFLNTDYQTYLETVYARIFKFKDWFEHTQNFPFPKEWETYSDFFFRLNT